MFFLVSFSIDLNRKQIVFGHLDNVKAETFTLSACVRFSTPGGTQSSAGPDPLGSPYTLNPVAYWCFVQFFYCPFVMKPSGPFSGQPTFLFFCPPEEEKQLNFTFM